MASKRHRKRDRLSDLSNEKDLTDEPADNIRAESRNIAHAHNDWECTFAGDLRVCHTWRAIRNNRAGYENCRHPLPVLPETKYGGSPKSLLSPLSPQWYSCGFLRERCHGRYGQASLTYCNRYGCFCQPFLRENDENQTGYVNNIKSYHN